MSASALFTPIRVGNVKLKHRVVMAPLTRFRANAEHVVSDLNREYYEQRSRIPGSLIIYEATIIAPRAGGYANAPGVWSEEQIAGLKKVVDTVHANGSHIFIQLWAAGRVAIADVLKAEGDYDVVSASDLPYEGYSTPRPLTIAEIQEYVELYAHAAKTAVFDVGFDGVEIHSANGYLPDQFLQNVSNTRTDEYGGSIENRIRFPSQALNAVVQAVGAERAAIRLSPWSPFQGMRMVDPVPTFTELVARIRDTHPRLAYLHVIEPRINNSYKQEMTEDNAHDTSDVIREVWGARPYIAAGGFERESAMQTVEKYGGLVAFGRDYIANPDLPTRLESNATLNEYDRSTFYGGDAKGYTDYPFLGQAAAVST